ncbi:DeSI-like protein [Seminavis robusta]|uniref:DeSI-like protein n=1 Tax=Seminavis robusta TaxID=568900 RepID=A0A9N8ECI6_9STRA|nr:DeSI-like protein [Seminavis robusta]|eukprot:Sro972_g226590.1 DeSI-like protein (525) ;mRNA; f:18395-19969
MTGGSVCCSVDTKSTGGDMAKSTNSGHSGGDDSLGSLPETVKALFVDEAREPANRTTSGEKSPKKNTILSVDEATRRDLINSITTTVEEWDAQEAAAAKRPANRYSPPTHGKPPLRGKIQEALLGSSTGDRYKPLSSVHSHSRGNYDPNTNSEETPSKRDDIYSLTESQRPTASSADESEYACKPQPHEDSAAYCGTRLGKKDKEEPLSAVLRKYQYPRNNQSANAWAAEQAQRTSRLFLRMSRQVRYGRRGSLPTPHRRNRIKLHIYDLIPSETVMQLPWGCFIPIGKCFDVVNSSLHSMGTGAYHVGVEVNGIEYSYGATSLPRVSGVFSCMPKRSPGYQYRTTIDFGERTLVKKSWVCAESSIDTTSADSQAPTYQEVERFVEGREVIKEMACEYMGIDYDLLRKNCVTFAIDACRKLGVKDEEIPTWFRNLCESGALTQDVAMQTVEPIQNIFSACEDYGDFAEKTLEDGFEVITKAPAEGGSGGGMKTVVMVIDSVECNAYHCIDCPTVGVRRTLSWTY